MGAIVLLSDLKTKAEIGGVDAQHDAELNQAIEQAEGEFQDAIRQKLTATDYVEHREGCGKSMLQLSYYPVIDLAEVEVEGVALDVEDENVIRLGVGTSGLPWISLGPGRSFPRPRWQRVPNVKITYGAGYADQAAIKDALPGVWSGVLEHAFVLYKGNEARRSMKIGESYMGQSYTFAPAIDNDEQRAWRKLIQAHKRLPISMMAGRCR